MRFRKEIRLPRDYYVRVHPKDYSVDPSAIGWLVQVTADLATVTVTSGTARTLSTTPAHCGPKDWGRVPASGR